MQILLKVGRYAGEIRDFPFDVARDMLRNGSAVDPYAEPIAPPLPQLETIEPRPDALKKSGRSGRTAGAK